MILKPLAFSFVKKVFAEFAQEPDSYRGNSKLKVLDSRENGAAEPFQTSSPTSRFMKVILMT